SSLLPYTPLFRSRYRPPLAAMGAADRDNHYPRVAHGAMDFPPHQPGGFGSRRRRSFPVAFIPCPGYGAIVDYGGAHRPESGAFGPHVGLSSWLHYCPGWGITLCPPNGCGATFLGRYLQSG